MRAPKGDGRSGAAGLMGALLICVSCATPLAEPPPATESAEPGPKILYVYRSTEGEHAYVSSLDGEQRREVNIGRNAGPPFPGPDTYAFALSPDGGRLARWNHSVIEVAEAKQVDRFRRLVGPGADGPVRGIVWDASGSHIGYFGFTVLEEDVVYRNVLGLVGLDGEIARVERTGSADVLEATDGSGGRLLVAHTGDGGYHFDFEMMRIPGGHVGDTYPEIGALCCRVFRTTRDLTRAYFVRRHHAEGQQLVELALDTHVERELFRAPDAKDPGQINIDRVFLLEQQGQLLFSMPSGDSRGRSLYLVSVATGESMVVLDRADHPCLDPVAVSPDGRYVAMTVPVRCSSSYFPTSDDLEGDHLILDLQTSSLTPFFRSERNVQPAGKPDEPIHYDQPRESIQIIGFLTA